MLQNYKVLNRMDIVLMYIRVVRPLNAAQSSHRSSLEEVYHICGTLETYSQHRHLLLEDLSMVSMQPPYSVEKCHCKFGVGQKVLMWP